MSLCSPTVKGCNRGLDLTTQGSQAGREKQMLCVLETDRNSLGEEEREEYPSNEHLPWARRGQGTFQGLAGGP